MNQESEEFREGRSLEGRYANYFKVGYNAFEFLLDFGQFYPEGKEARSYTRIITSPIYAKALLETLRESIDRYEQTFGAIPKEEGAQHGRY
ncbi:hypothetical protein MELA_00254 [Candidatus Methylomirabilis lanthanidiphila]|uniref:DUF3467 domain-containing protein n=1 Tax=Candidatus Methylomirabilis lanthanidiphila TaxID=2211376 RepID=A0A564ZFG3_9BACT|nr:DUF3467 domain-containing protein [Candidatus Methylomirabilis lanthanidiphila]VUZ83896.1 hypothetical protein MELA_00254 [Candidatus Methylomirabilis lanthanidiphila]